MTTNRLTRKLLFGASIAVTAPIFALVSASPSSASSASVVGNTPWAVLLCKYADSSAVPMTKAQAITTFTQPGNASMYDYWRDNSNGTIDLGGSVVDDWQAIGKTTDYHTGAGLTADRYKLVSDCIASHPNVKVTPTTRVLTLTNTANGHDSGGYQSSVYANATVLEGTNIASLYFRGQEMGHAYGLNHAYDSGGDPSGEYRDEYDVMGNNSVGLSAPDRYALGWLNGSRVATRSTALPSYELSAPFHNTRPGWDAIRVDDPTDATHFYMVEYRQQESWDAAIPFDGVVIHEVQADGKVVLQRVQPQPGIAALTANGSTWQNASGAVKIKLVCHDTTRGTATVTIDPLAYASCGSGFLPAPPNGTGTTYSGGTGSVDVCTTCGPKRGPIHFA